MPWMWIVGGPNGSGKSTLVAGGLPKLPGNPSINFNSDEKSSKLRRENAALSQAEADLCAVRANDTEVRTAIDHGQSLVTETVLSTDKYKNLVRHARGLGYSIGLLFVTLCSPELNIERVKLRVKLGGHNVDTNKIASRWDRSIANLAWFVENADVAYIYDNSESGEVGPQLIAVKDKNTYLRLIKPGINPRVDQALSHLLSK